MASDLIIEQTISSAQNLSNKACTGRKKFYEQQTPLTLAKLIIDFSCPYDLEETHWSTPNTTPDIMIAFVVVHYSSVTFPVWLSVVKVHLVNPASVKWYLLSTTVTVFTPQTYKTVIKMDLWLFSLPVKPETYQAKNSCLINGSNEWLVIRIAEN